MDIAPILRAMSQSTIQQHDYTVVIKTAMDTGKVAMDTNVGQNLNVIADNQMDKKEKLHKQLQQEIKWAQEKQKLLNLKEVKLLQMREIAEQGKQVVATPEQITNLNHRLDKLAEQVSAIDSDSRRTRDGRKLE